MVSIPVYVTIAMEMLARKLPQVGATPQWMLSMTTWMLSSRISPRITSTTWVIKSMNASPRFRALDSWIPMMLMTMRNAMRAMVAPTCHRSLVFRS